MFQFESPNVSCKSVFFSVLWYGMLAMVFSGIFQPLRFWLHLPLHLFSSAFFLATVNVDLCIATGGAGVPGMDPVLDWLDGLAKQILGILLATKLDDDPGWKLEYPCFQMGMFLQGYLGFGIVSYAIWVSEHNSRVKFIERLPRENKPREPVMPLQHSIFLFHVVALIVAHGVFWCVFLSIGPGIIKWRTHGAWPLETTAEMCSLADWNSGLGGDALVAGSAWYMKGLCPSQEAILNLA